MGDEGEDVALLLPAGFDHAQQGLHEAAARSTLGAEGQLSPDHRVTQGPLAGVVGWFDACVIEERPQSSTVVRGGAAVADRGRTFSRDGSAGRAAARRRPGGEFAPAMTSVPPA